MQGYLGKTPKRRGNGMLGKPGKPTDGYKGTQPVNRFIGRDYIIGFKRGNLVLLGGDDDGGGGGGGGGGVEPTCEWSNWKMNSNPDGRSCYNTREYRCPVYGGNGYTVEATQRGPNYWCGMGIFETIGDSVVV